jgi:hypothetical protein
MMSAVLLDEAFRCLSCRFAKIFKASMRAFCEEKSCNLSIFSGWTS